VDIAIACVSVSDFVILMKIDETQSATWTYFVVLMLVPEKMVSNVFIQMKID
jgi:hypothetical protein